jgi:hypothetical protein
MNIVSLLLTKPAQVNLVIHLVILLLDQKKVHESGIFDCSHKTFLLEKPSFDLSGLFGPLGKKEIRVKAGEPITIDIPINGSPTPTVTWSKDGESVPTGREFVFMKHLLFFSYLIDRF